MRLFGFRLKPASFRRRQYHSIKPWNRPGALQAPLRDVMRILSHFGRQNPRLTLLSWRASLGERSSPVASTTVVRGVAPPAGVIYNQVVYMYYNLYIFLPKVN